uniref:Uncharacterized protein n=1 Tax=Oryza sativa subsp. japonica TaxID=39947 RepID=Q6Z962_ORYSJ|nr:hypothetical protein [Oryza sativa Japonica Group]BAD09957.1 hypothetical protein [Oryza sativa Japonica Group]
MGRMRAEQREQRRGAGGGAAARRRGAADGESGGVGGDPSGWAKGRRGRRPRAAGTATTSLLDPLPLRLYSGDLHLQIRYAPPLSHGIQSIWWREDVH